MPRVLGGSYGGGRFLMSEAPLWQARTLVASELSAVRASAGDRYTTPESKNGSPKVNFPSSQWFSKVEIVSWHAFECSYPLQRSGVAGIPRS